MAQNVPGLTAYRPSARSDADDVRLTEIVDVVIAIASNDFSRRARVGDGTNLLDGLAAGINMLAEEVQAQHVRERAYQQQLVRTERLAAIGQLAAGVAHEVNNPAASLLLNLRTLEGLLARLDSSIEEPSLRAQAQQAREITRDNIHSVDRIIAIARDLRNFARLEKHQLETLDVDDVIDDACQLVKAEVSYRARLVVHPSTGLRVQGSRTKLAQVLTNLLVNAAQAIPEGAPDRNEVLVAAAERDGRVVLTISDTGAGLTPEAQAHLFEPFFTTKPRDRGTGLGLAISATIVRQHGGDLRLERTSPKGTVFEVILPPGGPTAPVAATADEAVPVGRAKVLIVDDDERLLLAFGRLFGAQYELGTARGGQAALQLLERDAHWDAVVCDLMMADFDGPAIFDWVEAHHPELADRMLFCTGGAFTARSLAFADRMADRLLHKPVLPNQIRAAIERVRSGNDR